MLRLVVRMPDSSHRRRQSPVRTDVIVLGAGAAGLACAASLVLAGRRPIVLEARPRIGGRIHTLHERGAGLPIELGAEFVHGRPRELLAIARAAGLSLCETGGESWRHARRGPVRFGGSSVQLAATLSRMHVLRDTSVSEALARTRASPEARAAVAAFVQGFDAGPPDETSARWIAHAQAHGVDGAWQVMRFTGGYDGVIDWLRRAAAGEDNDVVRTCVIARRVEWRPGRVRVTCTSPTGSPLDTLEAKSLVVTLPVGVLQDAPNSAGAVRFDPPLPPEHARALGRLAMGDVVKLVLRFRKAFWPAGLGFLQAAAEPVPTWWTVHPFDEPRIVGWTGGRPASALLALGEPRILEDAIISLARALHVTRARVERELSAWWMHDWSADPFARGAYAYARVGGSRAWRSLAAPIRGTLFLAGEAVCGAPSAGTVHGAIASGRRAARSVVASRG
jgi:monoamine oxidase